MKKLLMTAVCATAGLAALAEANDISVSSANVVGVLDVAVVAGRQQLVAVPFEGYDGGDVTVADIVKTSGLGDGSRLTAVSRDGKTVNAWSLEHGQWTAPLQVDVEKDGSALVTKGAEAATTTVSRGDAFWLEPKKDGTAYVLGAQPTSAAGTVPMSAGWNIVGNPNVEATPVSSIVANPNTGDVLVLDAGGIQERYTYDGSAWSHWERRYHEALKTYYIDLVQVEDLALKRGEGCWAYRNSAANNN